MKFYCIYCYRREVIGKPVSLLMCPTCFLQATCLSSWDTFWFDLIHGGITV